MSEITAGQGHQPQTGETRQSNDNKCTERERERERAKCRYSAISGPPANQTGAAIRVPRVPGLPLVPLGPSRGLSKLTRATN